MSRATAKRLVTNGARFLVTCHRRPDADALGSALGFAAILRELGKDVTVWHPERVPTYLGFLPGVDRVIRKLPKDATFDSTWVMDTAARALLPKGFPPARVAGQVVVVDHHVGHEKFGDVMLRDTAAPATSEVVLRLMADLGVERVPDEAATPLYAALVADTGGFRYPGTSAATLRTGARLLAAGVDPWDVAYHLFEDWPWERMQLLRAVLDTLETDVEGRFASIYVTRAMLERAGADEGMIEGLVNYGRMLRGVEVAALAWEQAPTTDAEGNSVASTKLSLRSRGRVDVASIAKSLGGGGHRGAAGATLELDVHQALARVRTAVARIYHAR